MPCHNQHHWRSVAGPRRFFVSVEFPLHYIAMSVDDIIQVCNSVELLHFYGIELEDDRFDEVMDILE